MRKARTLIAKLKPDAQSAVTNVASARVLQQQFGERDALIAMLRFGAQSAVTFAGRTSDLQQLDERDALAAKLRLYALLSDCSDDSARPVESHMLDKPPAANTGLLLSFVQDSCRPKFLPTLQRRSLRS